MNMYNNMTTKSTIRIAQKKNINISIESSRDERMNNMNSPVISIGIIILVNGRPEGRPNVSKVLL